jgi:hypothetical protein
MTSPPEFAKGLWSLASPVTTNVAGDKRNTSIKPKTIPTTQRLVYCQMEQHARRQIPRPVIKAGTKVRFTEKPFVNNGTTYDRGSLIITKSDNKRMDNFGTIVNSIANMNKSLLEPAVKLFRYLRPDFVCPT